MRTFPLCMLSPYRHCSKHSWLVKVVCDGFALSLLSTFEHPFVRLVLNWGCLVITTIINDGNGSASAKGSPNCIYQGIDVVDSLGWACDCVFMNVETLGLPIWYGNPNFWKFDFDGTLLVGALFKWSTPLGWWVLGMAFLWNLAKVCKLLLGENVHWRRSSTSLGLLSFPSLLGFLKLLGFSSLYAFPGQGCSRGFGGTIATTQLFHVVSAFLANNALLVTIAHLASNTLDYEISFMTVVITS
jgi:hypothetical protein